MAVLDQGLDVGCDAGRVVHPCIGEDGRQRLLEGVVERGDLLRAAPRSANRRVVASP